MTNPFTNEELYDKYTLAGEACPGIVTLEGLKKKNKWDIKDGDGQDGASTTRKGKVPAQWTAIHRLVYDPVQGIDEFAEWDAFLPLLKSCTAGTEAKAYDFYHPDAERVDVSSAVVEFIGALKHDGRGGATVEVGFLEYAPPKAKASSSPNGSKANSPSGSNIDRPDPNAAAKEELANLLKEAQAP